VSGLAPLAGGASQASGLNALDRLMALLGRLPGLGPRSACRLAYCILDSEPAYAHNLAAELSRLHSAIKRCSVCGGYTEADPCPICADAERDRRSICVVARPQDIRVIEEAREYRGTFHVLGGLIAPLDGVNPGDLAISRLLDRVRAGGVQEVILALNPSVEGDTTALYLQKLLKSTGAAVSRLASGLPVGGDIEYTDRLTLSRSFRARVAV
jgi:recombination protein RecR